MNLNIRVRTVKLSEYNNGVNFWDFGWGKDFLGDTESIN